MKTKYKRFLFLLSSIILMVSSATIALVVLRDEVVFFVTPSEVVSFNKDDYKKYYLRLGGYVCPDTISQEGLSIQFQVTDFKKSIWIFYKGILPDLFREGQGVIVEGVLLPSGVVDANLIMAKHDENYKPPEFNQTKEKYN